MDIFISWSGADTRAIAEFLRAWLPKVLMGRVTPFVSSQDISKGARGMGVIASSLEGTGFGLVLLTHANQDAKWINFEAGALSKDLGTSLVMPLLVDLTQADVEGPLAQFQMTSLRTKSDMWKLIRDINKILDGGPMPEEQLEVLFDSYWAELDEAVAGAVNGREPARTTRDEKDILDEILLRVRRIERSRRDPGPGWGTSRKIEVTQLLEKCITGADQDLRFRFRDLSEGMVLNVDAGTVQAAFDDDLLQGVADRYGVRIVLEPHDVMFTPRGRFRDPGASWKHWLFSPGEPEPKLVDERQQDRATDNALSEELYGHREADAEAEPGSEET
ncbi:TIR domain-containing protein [Microbacterium sp. NPDC056057]|uniref:TIR domain-containing protein n=1 Tax=Microbacterium sp. NPDC056057 TaxID=3345699 RepID=UPI0035E006C5